MDVEITPPQWLQGMALEEFEKNAAFMKSVNEAEGRCVYGDIDVSILTQMAVSFQNANESLVDERKAKRAGDIKAADSAQRRRISEERNYRDCKKLLGLDPDGRDAKIRKTTQRPPNNKFRV